MSFFQRFRRVEPAPQPEREGARTDPPEPPVTAPARPQSDGEGERASEPEGADAREPDKIRVARTLVKSEPELAELVASEPRLSSDGCEVHMAEKGFGTRVAITARSSAGLSEADLESLLDQLAEPQKRPFSNS